MSELTLAPLSSDTILQCPICDSQSQYRFSQYGYPIRQCLNCRHEFLAIPVTEQHVSQVYGDDYFQGGGAGYPNYLNQQDVLRKHGQQYGKLLRTYTNPGKMLDVGAAAGFILQGFMDYGWTGQGVEPNDEMAAYGRSHLKLPIQTGPLESISTDEQYDLVSMIQVIPHFYDLHQALQAASERTKSGGYWLIETWNRESWTARLLKQHWHEYSPPSVLRWFSPSDLKVLLAQYGFEEVATGRPSKWIQSAHAKSLLEFKFKDMGWIGKILAKCLVLVPNNIAIPYPSEDLFWGLYQKRSPE